MIVENISSGKADRKKLILDANICHLSIESMNIRYKTYLFHIILYNKK